jgi:hypothetical protein
MKVLKCCRAIRCVNVEAETNVSENSSISIIMVDVVNDRISLLLTPVCQTDASSYWCSMK